MTKTVSAFPTPVPQRSDPVNFPARADAVMTAFPGIITEMNLQNAENNALALQISGQAAQVESQSIAINATAAILLPAADAANAVPALVAGAQAAQADAEAAAANAVAVVTGGTASLKASPGKIPLASAQALLHPSWYAALQPARARVNDIGVPGTFGFGKGICPLLPSGWEHLPGGTNRLAPFYGDYRYTSDGSISGWVPVFYVRYAHADNPTFPLYGLNSVDVVPIFAYPTEGAAAADGYYIHRAFKHAGKTEPGFFYDKYKASKNGTVASSLPMAMPIVSGPAAGQTGFNELAGAPANNYSGALAAARTRGAQFFPATVFQRDALAVIAMAHGQAATSIDACAWYDAAGVRNFPLGCNNGSLKDQNDATLTFITAGASSYPAMPLTGSGSVFAKTTHNGQPCGIADVNGTTWDINPGVTTAAISKTITAASKTNPVVLGVTGHGCVTGQTVFVASVGGMTQLNDRMFKVSAIDPDTVSLDGVDGTAFSDFTSGGTLRTAKFYALKESTDMTTVTAGTSGATDLWGATGLAALYDEITPSFATTYPNNAAAQSYGNAAAQVFDWSNDPERLLAMSGFPAPAGVSPAGNNLFGKDYHYQFFVDMLCVLSGGYWSYGAPAGVRARALGHSRTASSPYAGFVAASYLP